MQLKQTEGCCVIQTLASRRKPASRAATVLHSWGGQWLSWELQTSIFDFQFSRKLVRIIKQTIRRYSYSRKSPNNLVNKGRKVNEEKMQKSNTWDWRNCLTSEVLPQQDTNILQKHIKKLLIVKTLLRYSYWVFIWPGDMKSVNTRFSFWNGTALKNMNLIKNQMCQLPLKATGPVKQRWHTDNYTESLGLQLPCNWHCNADQSS